MLLLALVMCVLCFFAVLAHHVTSKAFHDRRDMDRAIRWMIDN